MSRQRWDHASESRIRERRLARLRMAIAAGGDLRRSAIEAERIEARPGQTVVDLRDPEPFLPPQVIVASGFSMVGEAVEDAIDREFETVRCHTVEELAARIPLDGFDVAIVDQHLVDLTGGGLIDSIRSDRNPPAILTIAVDDSADECVRSLDGGATDCLPYPFSAAELRARVRALSRRRGDADAELRIGGWTLSPARRSIRSPYGGPIPLSAREASLLTVFAREPHQVFSRPELLRRVFTATSSPGTIDTYVHYLRTKTEPDIILTVHGLGYRLGEML